MKQLPVILLASLLLSACAVGPDYKRPPVATPAEWQWKTAQPQDGKIPDNWWTVYGSTDLNRLEGLAITNNQSLRGAMARVEQARAMARIQGAAFYPNLGANGQYLYDHFSKNNPMFLQMGPEADSVIPVTTDSYLLTLDLSYEIDLWGRVRRSYEAARAQAQASVADLNNILRVLTADVAIHYFTLRQYDAELQILRETVQTRKRSLEINQKRLQAGRATALDVKQAETELAITQSDLAEAEQYRAQAQNALALLCGQPASGFSLPSKTELPNAPTVPVGLPASLLERRPDVAAAERMMAAKNAEIGVAYAGFFPTVSLTGQAGYYSASASDFFKGPSEVWSIGPSVSLPLFTGGRTMAQVKGARADYEATVAAYRNTVLGAFRDVEDALAARKFLSDRALAADRAVTSSSAVLDLSEKRYRAGQVTYFEVTDAQRTELSSKRLQVRIQAQQLYASILLFKALGGGWDEVKLQPNNSAKK